MKTLYRVGSALAVCAFFAAAPHGRAAGKMVHEGLWEVTTKFEMEGMPATPQPMTFTNCVTAEEAKDPKEMIRKSQKSNDCKITDSKFDGNKLTWTMQCSGKFRGTANGEMVYNGDSYEGSFKMNVEDGRGSAHPIRYSMKGKRIGDCK